MRRPGFVLVLVLALAACRHTHPIELAAEDFRDREEPAPTLEKELDVLEGRCRVGQAPRIGMCEKDGRAWAWLEERHVIYELAWAYDVSGGKLAFVESRSWSDVCPAACLPDVVHDYGERPACRPVPMPVCGAIEDVRRFAREHAALHDQ